MLPFLAKPKSQGFISTEYRKPDESKEPQAYDSHMKGVEVAMRDLCDAEENKDYAAMARAFRAAFEILEAAPHEEIEHEQESE